MNICDCEYGKCDVCGENGILERYNVAFWNDKLGITSVYIRYCQRCQLVDKTMVSDKSTSDTL